MRPNRPRLSDVGGKGPVVKALPITLPTAVTLTISDFVRVATELKDPAIASTVGRAAAGCGVLPQAITVSSIHQGNDHE